MPSSSPASAHPSVDVHRLASRIERLALIGTTRPAFSELDREAHEITAGMMREAGLEVVTDAASNLIGRRPGRRDAPPIVFGSHIDTVAGAGRFDGALGTMAAIEVAQVLEEAPLQTDHPLEIVVFANEEGQVYTGLTGSRTMAGAFEPAQLQDTDATGRTLAEAVASCGGAPDRIAEVARAPGDIRAFVELHIEQGSILERKRVPIGIVQGIVCLQYIDIRALGAARHSGTTPMDTRHDALAAAARFILAVEEEAREQRACRVGTVGRLQVAPNAPNIIPGEVRLTLELRDLDEDVVCRAWDRLRFRASAIADDTGTSFEFGEPQRFAPAHASPEVMQAIRDAADTLGLPWHELPSGAGHDAQMMARLGPMGMIFVPSVGGISHSPEELTSWEDCAHGANVLLHTVLALDHGSG